jgi:uncharacterized damage-inducible protein DinB
VDLDGVIALFDYLYWIRDRALERASMLSADAFVSTRDVVYRDLRATLVHELDVERSWRLRLQGRPRPEWDVELAAETYTSVAALADHWQRDAGEARDWLATLNRAALAAPTTVNGLDGFPLSTYLVHVVMHGVESFSAAAILLDRAGVSMGNVGYLDFVDAHGLPGSTTG